ncbi:RNase H domain-containing protein [Trichonephila clavipes]|nr:RNase H domain-containing protein [Trichonephila clavipes]
MSMTNAKSRHDVRLTRLRIGHTRFTHRHLLLGENAPECPSCKVPYSVYHILIDCPVFNRHRVTFFYTSVLTLSDLAKVGPCAIKLNNHHHHHHRLAHHTPGGYYYFDFQRLKVAYEPMFSGDLSSPCCLLSPSECVGQTRQHLVYFDRTARATINLLKDTLGDRLISRFEPVLWPPRSCDLTPLDYFLWGYVKSLVYADKPQTLDHLEDNIRRVIADIRPQMLEKVIENWTSRLDYIRASRGSPMPEIIFKM